MAVRRVVYRVAVVALLDGIEVSSDECGNIYRSAFFFFQAEDGIRDYKVTGVQTCALPISRRAAQARNRTRRTIRTMSGTPISPSPRMEAAASQSRKPATTSFITGRSASTG